MGIRNQPPRGLGAETRLRWSYECGQLFVAGVASVPLLALAGLAMWLSERRLLTGVLAVVAVALGFGFAWYGRESRRALRPGILAGTVPLLAAFCAHELGAGWLEETVWLCVPLCIAGGAIASKMISQSVADRDAGNALFSPASAVTLAVGGMGCIAAGEEALLALVIGYLAPSLTGARRSAHRQA